MKSHMPTRENTYSLKVTGYIPNTTKFYNKAV